ncbi:purine-binding chemotaxis protein CheW [Candidatus Gracilibacteria bacterium]|nr:purine-binding chemotaxis protein CheW [Candidatus Gracilibacteria bacterium]
METDTIQQVVSQVAVKGQQQEKTDNVDYIQVLVFKLGNEEYAADIKDLREIIVQTEITPVPNSPEYISGILNLRGSVVVVIDLEKKFNLQKKENAQKNHIVITEIDGTSFGIIVDQVDEVIRVANTAIQKSPELISSKIKADYLKGVIVINKSDEKKEKTKEEETDKAKESRLLILLDLQKLLKSDELTELGNTIKKSSKPTEKPLETPVKAATPETPAKPTTEAPPKTNQQATT